MMLILAILPSIILFFIVWKGDRYEKEPRKLLLKLFLFGMLTTFSASIIEIVIGDYIIGSLKDMVILYAFIDSFFVVAAAEEVGKYFVLKMISWKHPAFNYTFDAVVYSVAVSLGFATLENIMYLVGASIGLAFARAVLSIPGHAIYAVYMGYYYGLAKHAEASGDEKQMKTYLKKALIVPILLHGFYDFCLYTENGFFILIFFVFEIVLTVFAVRKFIKLSKDETKIPSAVEETAPAMAQSVAPAMTPGPVITPAPTAAQNTSAVATQEAAPAMAQNTSAVATQEAVPTAAQNTAAVATQEAAPAMAQNTAAVVPARTPAPTAAQRTASASPRKIHTSLTKVTMPSGPDASMPSGPDASMPSGPDANISSGRDSSEG